MAYFEWADDLVIDQGPIDQDHQALIGLVNELHTATSQGCGQEVVGDILSRLGDYTAAHLQREERIMAQKAFPALATHHQSHDRFSTALQHIRAQHEAGRITTAAQLSALLRDWLSLHIRRDDRSLRDHMQAMLAKR